MRADQFVQRCRAAQDFRSDGIDGRAQQSIALRVRCFCTLAARQKAQQPGKLVIPVSGISKMTGNCAVDQVAGVGGDGDLGGKARECFGFKRGKCSCTMVAVNPSDRLGHEFIEILDELRHRLFGGCGLGHGNALNGVLVERASRLEFFQRIRTMNEFSDGKLVFGEIVAEQPRDRRPRRIGIKVVRLEAGKAQGRVIGSRIGTSLIVTIVKILERQVIPVLAMVALHDHFDPGPVTFLQAGARSTGSVLTQRGKSRQIPAALDALAGKALAVNFPGSASHSHPA